MSPERDLMERLSAADPAPEVKRLSAERQREAEALLERLLATPVEHGSRPRWRLRWTQLTAAAACASVALFVVLSLLGGGASTPNVVEKAAAALAREDAVYHVVGRVRLTAPDTLGGNVSVQFESWTTLGGRIHRKIYRLKNGRRSDWYEDFAGRRRPGRQGGPALRYDSLTNQIFPSGFGRSPGPGAPAVDPFDPSIGLRALEAQGRVKHEGSESVDGRRGYRLVSAPVSGGNGAVERSEIVVDAKTYLPLATRYSRRERDGSTVHVYERFPTYERLPLNDRTRAKLDLDPHPGAKCANGAGDMTGKRDVGFPNPCRRR